MSSQSMFAQPITSPSAEKVAKKSMQWFLRHSYIPLGVQLKHDWRKYVDLAVFQHNTSYHAVLG